MIEIKITDHGVMAALDNLAKGMANPSPVLRVLGEEMTKRIKRRFDNSIGPDGVRWPKNAESTLLAFIGARGGIGKRGKVTKKGAAIGAGKKPLIGHSGDLARQNHYDVSGSTLRIGNSMIYGAIQQFGGQAGRGRKVTIPARPFLPVTSSGNLSSEDQALVISTVSDYLRSLVK